MWLQATLNTILMIILSFVFVCLLGYSIIRLMGGNVEIHRLDDADDIKDYIKRLQEKVEEIEQERDE